MSNYMKNAEGYSDPTAFVAIQRVAQQEQEEEQQVSRLVFCLKYIIEQAGFELVKLPELRSKKSRRVYR